MTGTSAASQVTLFRQELSANAQTNTIEAILIFHLRQASSLTRRSAVNHASEMALTNASPFRRSAPIDAQASATGRTSLPVTHAGYGRRSRWSQSDPSSRALEVLKLPDTTPSLYATAQ